MVEARQGACPTQDAEAGGGRQACREGIDQDTTGPAGIETGAEKNDGSLILLRNFLRGGSPDPPRNGKNGLSSAVGPETHRAGVADP